MTILSYNPDKKAIKDYRSEGGQYYVAKCDICDTTFYPKRASARYCSNACNQISFRERRKNKTN